VLRCGCSGAPVSYLWLVAYDEDLADRIREVAGAEPDLTERRMFGGLAFLVSGNMAVAASGQGGIMVRADPGESDELVESGDAGLVVMRGRPMRGWLRVAPEYLRTRKQLTRWVDLGVGYARSLPPK
jgi:TfoX/Sxy family transcriptional regulator of competence genes